MAERRHQGVSGMPEDEVAALIYIARLIAQLPPIPVAQVVPWPRLHVSHGLARDERAGQEGETS